MSPSAAAGRAGACRGAFGYSASLSAFPRMVVAWRALLQPSCGASGVTMAARPDCWCVCGWVWGGGDGGGRFRAWAGLLHASATRFGGGGTARIPPRAISRGGCCLRGFWCLCQVA
jgi:hypothetical protein